SIEQATLPLAHGGSVVIISDAIRESPIEFWNHIARQKVNLVNCVPSFLSSIIHNVVDTASLDHIVVGGEPFTADLQEEISCHFNVARISNLYGPTEATIDSTGFVVANKQSSTQVPIGR